MLSVNPFAVAGAALPAGFLQGFLVVMLLAVVDGAACGPHSHPKCLAAARTSMPPIAPGASTTFGLAGLRGGLESLNSTLGRESSN